MRALALHSEVIVFTSGFWQTTCTVVRGGEEGFVIDSPVLPDELEALPGVLEQAGFPVSGLLATHGDWDHLLGRLAFPDAAVGCAESTAERLRGSPGEAQRELRDFDDANYVERPHPLSLGTIQALPVPGRLALGPGPELELHPTGGHTVDGMAIAIPSARVVVTGDYLSPVEIPWISESGSLADYRATLERLEPLVAAADTVVPGHGCACERERATALLHEDMAYLDELEARGSEAALPAGRSTKAQRKIHEENVTRLIPS